MLVGRPSVYVAKLTRVALFYSVYPKPPHSLPRSVLISNLKGTALLLLKSALVGPLDEGMGRSIVTSRRA
jgi:hypothetical protein